MLEAKRKTEIRDLISLSIDGSLNSDGWERLNALLKDDDEAVSYYLNLIDISYSLRHLDWSGVVNSDEDDTIFGDLPEDLLIGLARHEKTAVGIQVEKPAEPEGEKTKKKSQAKVQNRTVNKFSLYTSVFSAAALIAVILLLKFLPQKPLVATIVKSDNLQWSNKRLPVEQGCFLSTGKYLLKEGTVDLQLLQGTNVSLQAPIAFKLISENQIFLDYGRVFASVPQQAHGFAVDTASGKVTDLGTEFGVYIGREKEKAEVAVIKGKVRINKQTKGSSSVEETISEGNACLIRPGQSQITKTSIFSSAFAGEYFRDKLRSYELAVKNSSPVAYWNFNNIKDRSIVNTFGNNKYTGTIKGKVSSSSLNINGLLQQNKVLNFPGGKRCQVNFGNSDVFNPGSGSFTVAVWFNVDLSVDFPKMIVSKRTEKSGSVGRWRIIANNDNLFVRTDTNGNYGVWLHNLHCLTPGWHYVVMVIDREKQQLFAYLDGSSDGWEITKDVDKGLYSIFDDIKRKDRYEPSSRITNDEYLRLGGRTVKGDMNHCAPYKGSIYDMAIWKRALSHDEVEEIYNNSAFILQGYNGQMK